MELVGWLVGWLVNVALTYTVITDGRKLGRIKLG
jgi:hypothetical protein